MAADERAVLPAGEHEQSDILVGARWLYRLSARSSSLRRANSLHRGASSFLECPSRPRSRNGDARAFNFKMHRQKCGLDCGPIVKSRQNINYFNANLAEREGFEPPVHLRVLRISSAVRSTTLPPLRGRRHAVKRAVRSPCRLAWASIAGKAARALRGRDDEAANEA